MTEAVELRSGSLTARVVARGAELKSLRADGGPELIFQADPAWWEFSAPLLFPVIGRLRDGRIRHGDRWLALPQHGFARTATFALVAADAVSCTWRLADDDATRAVWPFAFTLDVACRLSPGALTVTVTAANRGDAVMPASIGFHPAFNWPARAAGRDGHALVFERDEPAGVRRPNADGLIGPRGAPLALAQRRLPLADALFVGGAQVLDPVHSRSLALADPHGTVLTVAWENCPQLGIWTKPGAPFVCIEPWHGLADLVDVDADLAHKPGIALVPPGGTLVCAMTIAVG